MNNWITKPFRDIATFPPKVSLEKEHFFSFIPMDVVNEGYKYVSPKEFKKWIGSGGAKFENGDTLFARITPCLQNGKIAQVKNLPNGKGFGSTEFFVFRGKENVSDTDFIYYLAKTDDFRSYAIGSMVGASGRQRADAKYVGNYEVNLPPLHIQKRIASILSTYDDLIENNLKRIRLLEEIAQRTYEEWFVKFRVNGEQLPIDPATKLPIGWERKRTDEICNFLNGYAYYTKGYSEDGYVILDLGNITEYSDLKITGKEKFVDEDLYNSTKKFHLYKYDVILAMTDVTSALRILGKTAIVDKDNLYALNQRVGCLRSKDENLDYSTIYALFNDFRFIEKMKAVSKGAVQFYINTKDILEYKHVIPNRDFIDMFTKIYKPILELKMNLKEQNEKLKQIRDILLPRLMSGTINVES